MNENELNELIVVEQLPKITQQLQLISNEIDKEIEYALSLECNEDSKNEVKKAKANLNKIKITLEEKRKQVKNAVMNPYIEFENVYNGLVKDKLVNADTTLKNKIDEIEKEQKLQKEQELREFVKQHCEANNVHIDFEVIGLNITLSASVKSLKEQALNFINKVVNDLKLIELEEYKDEILLEYNDTFDFTKSKIIVINRHKALEEIQQRNEELEKKQQEEEKVVEKVESALYELNEQTGKYEEISIPKEIIEDDEVIEVRFKIKDVVFNATGTKQQFIEVKEYFKKLGVEYE